VAAVRRAGGRIVGTTALTELCWDESGINEALGTPVNPLDAALVPGGSSSGSAVVVARGEADVALGTDTGGSVRIPAACCGVAGLKTTWGRIPLAGVHPLSPSYDTVGPIARDVAGLVLGMQLLEPGFAPRPVDRPVVARIRPPASPVADAAVDRALAATGWEIVGEAGAVVVRDPLVRAAARGRGCPGQRRAAPAPAPPGRPGRRSSAVSRCRGSG
jgi:amidase